MVVPTVCTWPRIDSEYFPRPSTTLMPCSSAAAAVSPTKATSGTVQMPTGKRAQSAIMSAGEHAPLVAPPSRNIVSTADSACWIPVDASCGAPTTSPAP